MTSIQRVYECDHCKRRAKRLRAGVCGHCGGWFRVPMPTYHATKPFACLVRDYDSFSVAILALDLMSGDLIPLEPWPIRNVSEAEARAVLEREA